MSSFSDYLQKVISNPNSDDRPAAIAELRRQEELTDTWRVITWVVMIALAVAVVSAMTLKWSLLPDASVHSTATAASQPTSVPATQPTHPMSFTWTGAWATGFVSLLWSVTFLLCGTLIGFLFGIPKTRQNDKKDESPARESLQEPNTNLEQISDWLTKIIVGLGLVHLVKVPAYLGRASTYMAECGVPCPPFACALIIAFSVLGFLSGYLVTRLFLASAFGRADLDGGMSRQLASIKIGPGGVGGTAGSSASTTGSRGVEALAATSNTGSPASSSANTRNPEFVRKWSRAKGRVLEEEFDVAVTEYAELVREFPDDIVIRLEYAWAIFKRDVTWSKLLQEQLDRAKAASPPTGSDLRRELCESLCFYSLYRDSGYEEAIAAGEEYVREPKNQLSASVYADLACAYGQKFLARRKANASEQELADLRNKALDSVRAAVRLDPNMAKTLQWQMAGPNREENDLQVFADQDDFRRAVFLPTGDLPKSSA